MTALDARWWRELRRAASWHRRLLAAGLAAGAVGAGLHALQPPPAATTTVLAAARDLSAGTTLAAGDLTPVEVLGATPPAGTLTSAADAVGRLLAGPVRAGEPLTDVRLVGPALVDGLPAGLVATPVRVADAAMVALVRPGDHVDVLATPVTGEASGSLAEVVGAALSVVAVPTEAGGVAFSDGALLVLATTPSTARAIAAATVTSRLSITLLGSG